MDESATVGSCRTNRLLTADNLVLLESSEQGLQYALDRFCVARDQVGLKIRFERSGVLSLQKPKPVRAERELSCTATGGEVQVPWDGIHE